MENVKEWLNDNGSGSGFGSGYGFGFGLSSFNGCDVFNVDGVETIITHIKDSFASGYVLNSDLTLEKCYIAKGQGYFAHGKNIKEAWAALRSKIFDNMDSDDVIDKFLEEFKKNEKYSGKIFFEWHHYLTGSCLIGRESFVKNRNVDLSASYTVEEFISICEDYYGGHVIKQLKEKLGEII